MIESKTFKALATSDWALDAARKRGLAVSECGNAIAIGNQFYCFLFMDIINEEQLDAWLIDRKSIKQTQTLNRLISISYELSEYRKSFNDILSALDAHCEYLNVLNKSKLCEFIFYMEAIGGKILGIETGAISLPDESWHPILERNWLKWNSCIP